MLYIYIERYLHTHTSIALFQLITYPERTNVSIWSTWMFPRSVPTYSHLLCNGRWMHVILFEIYRIYYNYVTRKLRKILTNTFKTLRRVYYISVSFFFFLFSIKKRGGEQISIVDYQECGIKILSKKKSYI